MSDRYAIGLDIGGTFTDLVLLDTSGTQYVHKLLTTPSDPAEAAIQGITELLERESVGIDQLDLLVHSTTLVTNTLIQQHGTPTGLLTTRGFRDVLEMRHEHRYDIYDLFIDWPPPLVPRNWRLPVTERITRDGDVLVAPSESEVHEQVDFLVNEGIKALAISFINSYKNPEHEYRVAEIVQARYPDLPVTLSSDVAPVIREYERTSTAVADAYVRPLAQAYLTRMEEGLNDLGFNGNFFLMLSGGGTASVSSARQYPVRLVESGPAGGAQAAALYGQLTEQPAVMSFDMGGTTAKICIIEDGEPTIVNQLEVARTQRFRTGSGLPLVVPSVELLEIGAGGGSLARADALGLLKVGPDSAGADPGPACYGRGGENPTVTDANLVLGYLDPGYFLGGQMTLDLDAAKAALATVGEKLGMSPEETAWGVHGIVNENMAQAARTHLLEKNWDPRWLTLVAFGGAGPAHAESIATLLGASRVLYPLGAGAASALGSLSAPLSFQFTQSLPGVVEDLDWAQVRELYADMEQRGREALADAGIGEDEVTFVRHADIRIYGQIHEMLVEVPDGELTEASIETLSTSFADRYRNRYSRFDPTAVLEAVNWKLTAQGPARELDLSRKFDGEVSVEQAHKGTRKAFFGGSSGYQDVDVYDRYQLVPGSEIQGPAIVEEREATVILHPGSSASVDKYWNLVAELPRV